MRVPGLIVSSVLIALFITAGVTAHAQKAGMIPPVATTQYSQAFHAAPPWVDPPAEKPQQQAAQAVETPAQVQASTSTGEIAQTSDTENQLLFDPNNPQPGALAFLSQGYLFRVIIALGIVLGLLYAFAKWVLPRFDNQQVQDLTQMRTMKQTSVANPQQQQQQQNQSLFNVLGLQSVEPEPVEQLKTMQDLVQAPESKTQQSLMKFFGIESPQKVVQPKILSRTKLGPGKEIHIVQLGDRMLAIGSTPHSVNLLTEVDSPSAEEFVQRATQIAEEKAVYQKYLTPPSTESVGPKNIAPPFSPSSQNLTIEEML